LQRLIDLICHLFAFLMVGCLALMVVMVFGNVVLRYGFNSGITVSEELSRWLFVWMTFMGAVVAVRNRSHLGTDALTSRLPLVGRKGCFFLAQVLMLFVCVLMFRGAWVQTGINASTSSAVMGVPMAGFYASGLMFSALAGVVIAYDLWRLLSGQIADSELVAVSESDDMPHGQPIHPSAAAVQERP
jgi:TRAP-type C4-dicarboxylate transport system permease small subunit